MNLIDILIILAVIFAIVRGVESGFFCQLGSLGGFILGLGLGAAIAPATTQWIANPTERGIGALVVIFTLAILVGSAGEYLGIRANRLAHRWKLGPLDAVLGAVFGAVIILVSSWLIANLLLSLRQPELSRRINSSAIVRALDQRLPPTPTIISRIGRLFTPNGFPQVFVGLAPTPGAPLPPPSDSEIRLAYDRTAASTVKLESRGCGGIIEGSGFVASSGYVMTNAHVVAGIARPVILDQAGRHNATVVYFDPDMDIAILRADGLAGPVLRIQASASPRGTKGAIMGYPGGGPLTASAAVILSQVSATGRNIYDSGVVNRDVYELQGTVVQGNSGGPLVDLEGVVIGLIFARSESESNIGYALTAPEMNQALGRVVGRNQAVSTGRCAAE